MKKLTALAALSLLLFTQRPVAQGAGLRIFFVDIGQGAGTLIVGPPDATGKVTSLLVDGGPPGGGTTRIAPLLDTLGIARIDYTVVTHYHIDHISGITELLQAGRVGAVAYDNGDDPSLTPPAGGNTRSAYVAYDLAATAAGIPRQQIQPGQVITLGPGVRATCIAAGGRLISRGVVPITNDDLNSESIALLVESGSFDYLVSGDLTGGGSTSTAKTPDVETYVGQAVGDVDVVQLNHHGSTTTSNQTFLAAVKAEVAVAQASDDNTFGHPHRETVNKYLNTPVTNLHAHTTPDVPPPGAGPVFYQPEAPVAGDDRVTLQGISAAAPGAHGNGTILLQTDGTTTYSLRSFDDGGVRINPALHTYPVDGVSPGVTTNFPPTVQVDTNPMLPLASEPVTVTAAIFDREVLTISSAFLTYALNGVEQPAVAMTLNGTVYQATIPAQPDGTRVTYTVAGTVVQPVIGAQTTTWTSGYFSGTTTVSSLHALTPKGEPLYTGYPARIRGTVTASAFSGSGTNDDYVQDATGAVNVYRSSDTPTVFTATMPGQTVEARGRVNFNGGRLRLDLTESIEKAASPFGVTIASSGPAPAPVTTTIAALSANPESFEGQFFSIANASITAGAIPATPQSLDSFVTISDGTGSLSMKIDDDTDIEGFVPAATFTAVGILQQDDFLRPFDAGYNLTPRSRVDLGAAGPGEAPLLTIAEARADAVTNGAGTPPADFVPDRLGQTVKVRGIVTSIDLRGGNGIEYYVQDSSGGIDLFSTTLNAGPFAFGDSVEAIGAVTHFNGLTELTVTSVVLLAPGAPPPPTIVTVAELGDAGAGEAIEGRLVRLNNVTISTPPTAFPAGNLTVSDGSGRTATIRIDSDTEIDGTPVPCGPVSFIGVVGQFDSTAPFDSGYQLFPRTLADIIVSSTPAPGCGGDGGGGAGGVVISEFRTRGPAGGNDEFVEIYNNTDRPVDIAGWQLRGSSNTAPTGTRATVPAGVVLPGRAHYLFVNLAANGYSGATTGNMSYTTGIGDNGGIALAKSDGTIVDQVGVVTTLTGYREGSPLATQLTSNTNRSYERKPAGSATALQDTDDNLSDFRLLNGTAPDVPNPQNTVLTASPASVDFGSVVLPATSVRTVTVKNLLLSSVTLNAPAIAGADAAAFSSTPASATTLASLAAATTDVTFAPAAPGSRAATLSITSSNSGTVDVALSGLAVCPAVSVTGTVSLAEFGFAYSQTISATGGTGPYTFGISAGSLPPGVGLDPSGVLSGTPTALGTFTFSIEAQTAIGCGGTASFTLTVVDTTPPALTLPGDLTAVATTPAGAIVSFSAAAVDLVSGSLTVACAPASGTTFPIGATVVSCAAADAQGNRATGGFRVTVTEPAQPGRIIGDGRIESGGIRHDFEFAVEERTSGADAGTLRYRAKDDRRGRDHDDRFEGVATRAVFFNVDGVSPGRRPDGGIDTALISGIGRWNGAAGYTFEAQATDAGEPGRGHDRFAVTIRDGAGRIVSSVDGMIDQGNIQSLRIAR